MGLVDADVCVVAAGIVGLAHAFEARARGLSVSVVDRSEHAVGASVRNFGHVIVSAMADGPALQCALRARERWVSIGRRAGLGVHEAGTVIVARAEDELAVMAGVAADPRRGARMVTARELGALAPVPTRELVGGLHAQLDLRVDPRRAVGALASLLDDDEACIHWGATVHDVEPGAVHTGSGTVRAAAIIVCPGPDYGWLAPALAPSRTGLTRCKLQMLRVAAPARRRYGPALLTALSLLRYPGFSSQAGIEPLRARLVEQRPELIAAGVHLIVTQLPDGDLVLGDTHEYSETVSPFGDERLDELVLAEARRLLGAPGLRIRQRWHGVYPSAPGDPFLIAQPSPGVAVVEIVSGIGMTTALGLAPLTFEILARPAPVAAATGASAAAMTHAR